MAVTLINVFSVPRGKETEFVKWWQDVKEKHHGAARVHQREIPSEHQAGEPVQFH